MVQLYKIDMNATYKKAYHHTSQVRRISNSLYLWKLSSMGNPHENYWRFFFTLSYTLVVGGSLFSCLSYVLAISCNCAGCC